MFNGEKTVGWHLQTTFTEEIVLLQLFWWLFR